MKKLFSKMLIIILIGIFIIPVDQIFASSKSQLINKVSTSRKIIALTFDDGSDGGNIKDILTILSENDIKGTFFLTGSAAASHPKLVKRIVDNGNAIGNHSYTHPMFTKLSSDQINKELAKTEKIIKELTKQSTKPYFRPPYGDCNSTVLKVVAAAGYTKTITWTIDTLDWKGISAKEITKKVLSKATPGAIVLMHAGVGAAHTPEALPDIINGLKDMGYQFATIPELLDYISLSANEYIVRDGDTLECIAKLYGVSVDDILKANNMKITDVISTNQIINIPGLKPTVNQYIVKKGDTLSKISRAYGITVNELASINHITNVNLIYPNQILVIPKQ